MSKNIQFMHFRHVEDGMISSRGGATVAYRIGKDGKIEKYAVAYCSPNDNYSRAEGRNLAAGRLQYKGLSHSDTNHSDPAEFRAHMEAEMTSRYGLSRPHMRRRTTDRKLVGRIAATASQRH